MSSLLLKGVSIRLRTLGLGGTVQYGTQRIPAVRRAVHWYRRLQAREARGTAPERPTLFPSVDVNESAVRLRRDAYATGWQLPSELLLEIRSFLDSRPVYIWADGKRIDFPIHERRLVEQRLGRPIVLAFYDLLGCPQIDRVLRDAALANTFRSYYGYNPRHFEARAWWSFVAEANDEFRHESLQTTRYHYDLHDFGFLYWHFYLSNVDEGGGPHTLFRGSHQRRPLRFTFSSAVKSDEQVRRFYGAENEVVLIGDEGFGFVEDTFCYHKALAPTTSDRLILQLRVN